MLFNIGRRKFVVGAVGAVVLSGLAVLALLSGRAPAPLASSPGPTATAPVTAPAPLAPSPRPAAPVSARPPVAPLAQPLETVPEFPWPPPTASASYVLPDRLFANRPTVGDVTAAILSALEHNGYVERSFFQTPVGGVALVTRLERINDDGSSAAEVKRWPAIANNVWSADLITFLRGLFYVDPGHYRVIVFILQDLPFTQSSQIPTSEEVRAWLISGANVLPPGLADRSFKGGHCTILIYEFAADGTGVRLIQSSLTGKEHLEKAGVLALLDKVN